MRVLLINGSPKGKASNSLKLASCFIEGLTSKVKERNEDVLIDEVHVAKANIAPCKGCFACWKLTPGVCCIKDDMKEVIEKELAADIIVWSFPLYYYNVPGSLKNLIDRQLPMNLPFMSTREDGYGSGSHESRYDMSGKRHVLVSTCGFYSAQGNYDSVRQMFNHFVGKDRYETIFCGQGELFHVKELESRTGEYLKVVKTAGEEFEQGGITPETKDELQKLLFPREVFEKMADASWGISREQALAGNQENKDNQGGSNMCQRANQAAGSADDIFTRQMAAMYNKKEWGGSDRVLEMHYTDLDKTYQILLGKDGSEVYTDSSLKATTHIDTTFDVWVAISRGEINGAEALSKQMYTISGDFSIMINWGKIFGGY